MDHEPVLHRTGTVAGDVVEYFGEAYPTVSAFTALLADEGVTRGLIGPREVPRLWDRHIINSAAVAAFLPSAGTLVDVGTGAGLPGVVLAAMRPDLDVVLVEPMERRVTWLLEVVASLGLRNTEVLRARAEDLHGQLVADVVTARAVAPMDRLVGWTLPLLRTGGVLLAMKGQQASDELDAATEVIAAWGGAQGEVLPAPTAPGFESTTVVRLVREHAVTPPGSAIGSKRAAARTSAGSSATKRRRRGAPRR